MKKQIFKIKLKPISGVSITTTCCEAKRIAKLLSVLVKFKFNGVKFLITEDTKIKQTVEYYYANLPTIKSK